MKIVFTNRINYIGLLIFSILELLSGIYLFRQVDLIIFAVYFILFLLILPYIYMKKKYILFLITKIGLISFLCMILYLISALNIGLWLLFLCVALPLNIAIGLNNTIEKKILVYQCENYNMIGNYNIAETNKPSEAIVILEQTDEIICSSPDALMELYNLLPQKIIKSNLKILEYFLQKNEIKINYEYILNTSNIVIISNDAKILETYSKYNDITLITDNYEYQYKFNAYGFDHNLESYKVIIDLYIINENNFESYKSYIRELNKIRTSKIIIVFNIESIILENCLLNGLKELFYKKIFDHNTLLKIIAIRVCDIYDIERNLLYEIKNLREENIIISENSNTISLKHLIQFVNTCLDNIHLFNNKFTILGFHKNISSLSIFKYYNFDYQKNIKYDIYNFHNRDNESKSLFEINNLSLYVYKIILVDSYSVLLNSVLSNKTIDMVDILKLYVFQ